MSQMCLLNVNVPLKYTYMYMYMYMCVHPFADVHMICLFYEIDSYTKPIEPRNFSVTDIHVCVN